MSIYLTHLKANNFRNLNNLELNPSPLFNILYGDNGSGKTSCLEAIYYLGLARSFRSRLAPRIITHEQPHLSLHTQLQSHNRSITLGIERHQNGSSKIRINGEDSSSGAALAEALPLQLIDSSSHNLLTGGPKPRRQFMDWGVFHVEHAFLSLWQNYYRALKQRNTAIKQHMPLSQIKLWDETLSQAGVEIDRYRQDYLAQLIPIFLDTWQTLMGIADISIRYTRGWTENKSLIECLQESASRDLQLGYTYFGIHRSDLFLSSHKTPVQDILSRGQQKLLVYALKLSQGKLLQQQTGKTCIYLIDDLSTELDQDKRQRAASVLATLGAQVFATGVFEHDLSHITSLQKSKLFHVEQGIISEACY